MEAKKPRDSITKMEQVVLASHANGQGRLFGGQLMSWLDVTGAICARRHSGCEVVTAKADNLEFHRPAMQNDIVTITIKIIYAGTTSMEVRVCAYVELKEDGSLSSMLVILFTLPWMKTATMPVPKLIPESKRKRKI